MACTYGSGLYGTGTYGCLEVAAAPSTPGHAATIARPRPRPLRVCDELQILLVYADAGALIDERVTPRLTLVASDLVPIRVSARDAPEVVGERHTELRLRATRSTQVIPDPAAASNETLALLLAARHLLEEPEA